MAKQKFNAGAYFDEHKAALFAFLAPLFEAPEASIKAFKSTVPVTLRSVDKRTLGKRGAPWFDYAPVVPAGFEFVIVSNVSKHGVPYLRVQNTGGTYGVLVHSDPEDARNLFMLEGRENAAWLVMLCEGVPSEIGDTTPAHPGSPRMWAIGATKRHALSPRDTTLLDLVEHGLLTVEEAERLLVEYGDCLERELQRKEP